MCALFLNRLCAYLFWLKERKMERFIYGKGGNFNPKRI